RSGVAAPDLGEARIPFGIVRLGSDGRWRGDDLDRRGLGHAAGGGGGLGCRDTLGRDAALGPRAGPGWLRRGGRRARRRTHVQRDGGIRIGRLGLLWRRFARFAWFFREQRPAVGYVRALAVRQNHH